MSDATSSTRRELRDVLRIAFPFALAQLAMQSMGVVDVMMLGRLGEEGVDGLPTSDSMAAAGIGNVYALGLQMPTMGLLMALDPLVSQAFGARNHDGVARALRRGLVLSVLLCIPLFVLSFLAEPILRVFKQEEHLIPLAADYVKACMPGIALQLAFFAFRQVLQAMSIARPVLITVLIANVLNFLLNLGFVFGYFGFPEMGVLGSGIATGISRGLMGGLLLFFAWPHLRPYLVRHVENALHWRKFANILAIGIPIAIQVSLEVWVFQAVSFGMGSLGSLPMAGHQVAISLAAMAFMVPLSVGMAASTRVGNAIGRGDMAATRRAATTTLGVGVGFMVLSSTLFLCIPQFLSRGFTNDPEVIAMAATLLPVAAAFQVFDGVQVVCLGILRGSADTRVPALINLIGYWGLGVPVGWWLAFRTDVGPAGLWWGLVVGLGTCAVALSYRVAHRLRGPIERLRTEA